MCVLAAMSGVVARGLDRNILVEIGLVVLIGLAAKNAILIVEFAKQAEEAGQSKYEAAVSAARTRLRPILMTSLAFILGVAPLATAVGAGAEMRQSLGTAVFFGMLGVTFFGLIFTPTFYVLVRSLGSAFEPHSLRRAYALSGDWFGILTPMRPDIETSARSVLEGLATTSRNLFLRLKTIVKPGK